MKNNVIVIHYARGHDIGHSLIKAQELNSHLKLYAESKNYVCELIDVEQYKEKFGEKKFEELYKRSAANTPKVAHKSENGELPGHTKILMSNVYCRSCHNPAALNENNICELCRVLI
jgi:hypothetical protein